jgi:hypothetical protein
MKRQASLETPCFKVWMDPDLPPEKRSESISAILRYCLDPPRPLAERRVAVKQLLHLFPGSARRRAQELERQYQNYLGSGWRREKEIETLPEPRTVKHSLLHRLARVNGGRSLRWRRIFDIAAASSPQD